MVSHARRLASAVSVAALVCVAAPAQAQVIDSLLSAIGLKPTEEAPEIDYRERAPLVVPPQMKLPPPEAPPAARSSQWPTDPDVVRRADAAKAAAVPRPNARESNIGDGKLMRPGDVPGGRTARRTGPQEPAPYEIERSLAASGWVPPDKLRAMGRETRPDTSLVAGQEPPRRYLTDPPTGMRVPSDRGPLTAGRSLAKPGLTEAEEKDPLRTFRPKPKSADDE